MTVSAKSCARRRQEAEARLISESGVQWHYITAIYLDPQNGLNP